MRFFAALVLLISSSAFAAEPMGFNGGMGLGGLGAYGSVETRPVTPLVRGKTTKVDELNDKIRALERDRHAQLANTMIMQTDRMSLMQDLNAARRDKDAAARAGSETHKFEAEIDVIQEQLKDYRAAWDAAVAVNKATAEKITALSKERDAEWGKSMGWHLSESAEDKKLAAANGFSCSSGERQVATLDLVYNWGCLNSKGFMTKQATRAIGMPEYDTDTTYERDGDELKKVTVTNRSGKTISEKTVGVKEETSKYFDKDGLRSSCTVYGDAKSRAGTAGVGYGMVMSGGGAFASGAESPVPTSKGVPSAR